MGLQERLKSESTAVGQLFKTWIAGFLGVCSAVGALGEYFSMLPPGLILPTWLKWTVFAAGAISFVYGHLTVKKPNEQV